MSTTSRGDRWIAFRRPAQGARVRLFCLPFAGGSASAYSRWVSGLGPYIDVCPVQLPGREARIADPPYTSMESLVNALSQALAPYLDLPYAVFGHSMGAAIAYEVAERLRSGPHGEPVRLLVSARHAPHLPGRSAPIHDLPDAAFKARLQQLNGTPAEVLANPELMELLLPTLRADFELNDTYQAPRRTPLGCPVTAFGALNDAEIHLDDMAAWQQITHGDFRMQLFPGDHFYISKSPQGVMAAVKKLLCGM
jgi:medium-chain acyl-[acyl-carrier-protein] hydrolase